MSGGGQAPPSPSQPKMIVLRQKLLFSGIPVARLQGAKGEIALAIATALSVEAARVNITGITASSRRQLFARLLSLTAEIEYELRFREDDPETSGSLSAVMSKMVDMGDGKLTSQKLIEELSKRLGNIDVDDLGMSSSPPQQNVEDIPVDDDTGGDNGRIPGLLDRKNIGGVYAACVLAVVLLALATVYGVQTYREDDLAFFCGPAAYAKQPFVATKL